MNVQPIQFQHIWYCCYFCMNAWSCAVKINDAVKIRKTSESLFYFSPFSFERQKCISRLMRLLFFVALSASVGAAVSSNLSLLPFTEPGMSRLRLARLARFQA